MAKFSIYLNRCVFVMRLVNSVDPDEASHYGSSHLDLHCLHRYLCRSTDLKLLGTPDTT